MQYVAFFFPMMTTNGCIQTVVYNLQWNCVVLDNLCGWPHRLSGPPTFWLHWRIPSCHLPDWPSAEAAKPKVRHLLRKGLPLVWSHSICFANSFTAAACRLWGLVWRGRLQRYTLALAWPQAGLCAAKRPQLSESLSILWGRGRARDCPSVRPCCPLAPAHCPSCPHRLHSHVTPVSFFHAAPPLAASPLITSLCDCGSLHFALPLFFFFLGDSIALRLRVSSVCLVFTLIGLMACFPKWGLPQRKRLEKLDLRTWTKKGNSCDSLWFRAQ